jgi:pilus assembly protein CpaC
MRSKFSHGIAFVFAMSLGMSLPLSAQQSTLSQGAAPVGQRGAASQGSAPTVRQNAAAQGIAPAVAQQNATSQLAVLEQGDETAAPMVQLYMTPSWQAPQELENSFHLYVGETRVVKLPSPVAKTAIGNGKVVSTAMVNANDLLIIASDAGRSMVHLWLKNGTEITYAVEVGLNSPAKTYAQVRDMLAKEENIQVSLVGNRVFLRAETLKAPQIPLIDALQKAFPDQVVLITGNDVALEERTVHLTAQLVEIRRSALEKLGVQWAESIYGPQAAIVGDMKRLKTADGSVLLGIRPKDSGDLPNLDTWPGYTHPFKAALSLATLVSSRINLLRSQGDAYLVAEPRLTTRCGGKADFTSGGELPIPVQNGLGSANVEFREYGIRLAVEPTCDKLGNIRAKVSTEVSQIDPAVSVMGVPGLLTRKAMSELDLIEGQSMLLSGLASHTAGESENRVPFLGKIPLLGHLFKNNDKNGERTELVVIITPSFISADSETVRKSLERRKQLSGETEDKLAEHDVKPLDWKPDPPLPVTRDSFGVEGADIQNVLSPASPGAAANLARPAPMPTATAQPQIAPVMQQNYTLKGDVPWRPRSVWDDGQHTVIEMPEGIPADRTPSLLIVKPAAAMGNKAVSYRVEGTRYLVDGLFDSAVLVAGSGYYRQSVMIERQP